MSLSKIAKSDGTVKIIKTRRFNFIFPRIFLPLLSDSPTILRRKKPSCFAFTMDVEGEDKSDYLQIDQIVEEDTMDDLIRDRFRLSAISIAETEAKKNGMEIAGPVVACVADLAFKYAENVAKDLELFAHHAGRKVVNMDDVVLSAHRNDNLAASLRSLCNDLKAKEPQSDRKRKKGSAKREDKASSSNAVRIPDL
ncbi:PREDICTED: centromere protein S-like [Camelina sativa]|uniref:Centromere protein S-like n=1 Tax=Camelina sativa TaxID=90675 RepID=A0ABM0UKR6_CAMSA|nr:PREDICTED: centromere protein S-like [Camelina sativa]